jgi:hypothetical protein
VPAPTAWWHSTYQAIASLKNAHAKKQLTQLQLYLLLRLDFWCSALLSRFESAGANARQHFQFHLANI